MSSLLSDSLSTPVFFSGILSEAIATSLTQNLYFVALVTDNSPEAISWESDYFDPSKGPEATEICNLLREKAVLYKINFPSHEANNLYAFCSRDEGKSGIHVVVIRSGILVGNFWSEDVAEGSDAVVTKFREVLEGQAPSSRSIQQESQSHTQIQPSYHIQSSSIQPNSITTSSYTEQDQRQPELPANSQNEQSPQPRHTPSQPSNPNAAYAEEALKRRKAAEEERQRIRAQIEADKAERKSRALKERQERDRSKQATSSPAGDVQGHGAFNNITQSNNRGLCALLIRLSDGSSLKHKFSPEAILGKDVRKWIDENKANTDINDISCTPYTFMHLRAPLKPNRKFEVGEEGKSLIDLELTPSATLILIPPPAAANVATAYPVAEAFPSVGTIVSMPIRLASGCFNLAYRAVGSIVGYPLPAVSGNEPSLPQAAQQQAQPSSSSATPRSNPGRSSRIRTLHSNSDEDERTRRPRFYNGNQLSFEPNVDDEGGAGSGAGGGR